MKLSTRKLSILGFVLLAASAVTAAVIPSKAKDSNAKVNNGHLSDSTGASGVENTCREAGINDALDCTYTETGLSSTSGAGSNASTSNTNVNGDPTGTGTSA